MKQENLDVIVNTIYELQKICQDINEAEFNNIVTNTIRENCVTDNIMNKKFLTAVFELIHDNIYGTSKGHNALV
jgi:hypothetical protein